MNRRVVLGAPDLSQCGTGQWPVAQGLVVRATAVLRGAIITSGLSVMLGGTVSAGPPQRPGFVGEPDLDFTSTVSPALVMPSAVAIAGDGTVFVCDGVNDRILRFDSSGGLIEVIGEIDGEALDRPMSVKADAEGRLWVADTGHGRVRVRAAGGESVVCFTPTCEDQPRPPDLTDLAPIGGGETAWCVDNDGHALLRVDTASGRALRIGQPGPALGQLDYPFMMAVGDRGDVYVTDVLNGRVAVFNAAGQPLRSIGSYGLSPGQFYRPAGVALDANGQVWVSDGTLGVVQVFSAEGAFLGVLRDAHGRPLHFEEPAGLAFDASGRLYVVESAARRVRRTTIHLDPNAPPETALPVTLVSPQPRACTACHLEWMEPLINGQGTELIDVPSNPADHPLVGRSATCRSCHAGTIVDSRRQVWVEHGHREGVVPRADMLVPRHLPLVDGEIACRTCHSAHTRGGSGNALRDAVFLRVERDPGELCAACHTGLDAGAAEGMHPLGPMSMVPVRGDLHEHGPVRQDAVTCLGCHVAHGPSETSLLAVNPATNAVCLVCHETIDAPLFAPQARRAHAQEPALTADQQAVAAGFQTRTGPRGELLCLTCHRAHHAPVAANLLVFDPAQQDTCAACHSAQLGVVGTSHDLSVSHPEATNSAGLTAAAGGPCSACHRAHRDGRPPRPTDLDRLGRCANCHAAGEVAAARRLGEVNHPKADCTACHDPHEARHASHMKARPMQVCIECHANAAHLVGGPHDVRRPADRWPASAAGTRDACLACHRPHGAGPSALWRAGLAAGVETDDAACVACHREAARGASSPLALVHSPDAKTLPDRCALPRADNGQRIACRTCHDPHGSAVPKLLRVEAGAKSEQLCFTCHETTAHIGMIGHGDEFLRAAGLAAHSCQPCHQVHADPEAIDTPALWPAGLCPPEGTTAPAGAPADRYCLCCHRAGGRAPVPAVASHPAVDMYNREEPGTPEHLPLFNSEGKVDPKGTLGCHTCHLTHGRPEPIPLPEGLQTMSPRELRARVWHIRRFVTPNVCTTCHGPDALRRFMYFHDPARRGGPIETGTRSVRTWESGNVGT